MSSLIKSGKCALIYGLIALTVTALAVSGSAAVGADETPPEIPASYYGEIGINGEPAPVGTEIVAVIDGEERGSIVVDEPGQFGGPDVSDDKLSVDGESSDTGEPVEFYVYGQALTTDSEVTWESGDLQEITLTGDDIGVPFFDVEIDTDASETLVEPGEEATVVADIENTGDAGGEAPAEFVVDEETLERYART